MVFITRPISAALLVVAVGAVALAVFLAIRRRREVVFQEELYRHAECAAIRQVVPVAERRFLRALDVPITLAERRDRPADIAGQHSAQSCVDNRYRDQAVNNNARQFEDLLSSADAPVAPPGT